MTRVLWFVALPALLIAAVFWLWPRAPESALPVPAEDAPAAASRAPVAQSGAAPDASPGSRVTVPLTQAVSGSEAPPPMTENAREYEVLVIDHHSRLPVPDADVWWYDSWSTVRMPDVPYSQRPFQLKDPEQLARTYGWYTRTDAQGRARVRGWQYLSVHARAGTGVGSVEIREEDAGAGPHQIELRADLTLQVRVVDGHGAPVAGVPLCITQHGSDGQFLRLWPHPATHTDPPDGIAWFAHLQTWQPDRERPPAAEWRVRTQLPGWADPGVAFDPKAPPAEPLVLRLPPCGSLVLRLEFAGRPLPRQRGLDVYLQLRLGEVRPEAGLFEWFQWADAGSDVRFAAVPVGRTFTAHLRWLGVRCEQAIAGPGAAGQEVTTVVRLPDDLVGVSGRLLGPDRQPLRNTRANVDLQASMADSSGAGLSTDGEGRFLMLLGRPDPKAEIRRFALWWRRVGGPVLRAELAPRKLAVGVTDVGDLVVQPER